MKNNEGKRKTKRKDDYVFEGFEDLGVKWGLERKKWPTTTGSGSEVRRTGFISTVYCCNYF